MQLFLQKQELPENPAVSSVEQFNEPVSLETPNDAASFFLSVNSKTLKKSIAHRGETTRSAMVFFEVLPFTDKNDAAL